MAANNRFDHIVIGAGIVGSSTALYLARLKKKVLLLEQFPVPNTRGGSQGHSRIIRTSYPQEFYTKMMVETFPLWEQIEKEANTKLIVKTGLITAYKQSTSSFEKAEENMKKFCPDKLHLLTASTMQKCYPLYTFTDDFKINLDETGGVVLADKAILAVTQLFTKYGGTLLQCCPVTGIKAGKINKVETANKGIFETESLIICPGAWASKVLKFVGLDIPIEPVSPEVCYWKVKNPELALPDKFPVFIYDDGDMHCFGLPSIEYPGCVKICIHGGEKCDPDRTEHTQKTMHRMNKLCNFIRKFFPGLEDKPVVVENCIYAYSPDDICFLDRHPLHKNILISTGFSGTGFKIAPMAGKLLSQLALNETPSFDLLPFSISRIKK